MKEYVLNEKKEIFLQNNVAESEWCQQILDSYIIMELEIRYITAHKIFINSVYCTLDAEFKYKYNFRI